MKSRMEVEEHQGHISVESKKMSLVQFNDLVSKLDKNQREWEREKGIPYRRPKDAGHIDTVLIDPICSKHPGLKSVILR